MLYRSGREFPGDVRRIDFPHPRQRRKRKSDIMQFSSVSLATSHPSHAPNGNPPRGKAQRVFASDWLMKCLGKIQGRELRDLIWGSLSFPLPVSYNYIRRIIDVRKHGCNRFRKTCISRRYIWQQRKRPMCSRIGRKHLKMQ